METHKIMGLNGENERSLQLRGANIETAVWSLSFASSDRADYLLLPSIHTTFEAFWKCLSLRWLKLTLWRCLRRMTRKWNRIATAPCGIGKRLPLRYHRACACSFLFGVFSLETGLTSSWNSFPLVSTIFYCSFSSFDVSDCRNECNLKCLKGDSGFEAH